MHRRRAGVLKSKGIHYMGMGISGGEEGARNGPSLMPGGPREAFDMVAPILRQCAAQVDDGPCTAYIGPIGSGNYVKMVFKFWHDDDLIFASFFGVIFFLWNVLI